MKIAYRLSGLELLFFKSGEHQFFPIVEANSTEEKFAKESLKLENIISIHLKGRIRFSELPSLEIPQYSDLGEKMNALGVHYFLIKKSDKRLEEWSKKHNIKLICPEFKEGISIENKVYFDEFLTRHNLPKPNSKIISSASEPMPFKKTVLQIPDSTGGEGTFIINRQKSFHGLTKKFKMPLLAREYVNGLSLGASLFLRGKDIYHTSLERQCFDDEKTAISKNFIGIQWIPHTFFGEAAYKKIHDFLRRIGTKLSQEGLKGLINIDFILGRNGEVYCIECNPRLTCATNQILALEELRAGVDFLNLYLEPKTKGKRVGLPKNRFAGCQMFISFPSQTKFPYHVRQFTPSGFFVFEKGSIKKIELQNHLEFFKIKNGFFYYNEISQGEIYQENIQIGTIVANFPLYSFKTGKPNKAGKKMYQYFTSQNA